MNISAIIPARISSKRLPHKNIKKLNGKPLLFWSIDVALKAECFNTICISTESYQVADLVRAHYSKDDVAILMRPEKLSTDTADLRDVCCHFLDQYCKVDMLYLMMPTYPFRSVNKIKNCIIPAIYSGYVDRVVSVQPEIFSTFDYWIKSDNNYIRMFKYQPLWCEAGNATYSFMKRDYFYKEPHSWKYDIGEREFKVITDFKEAIDIDTEDDWIRATKIANGYTCKYKKLTKKISEEHEFIVPIDLDTSLLRHHFIQKGCNLNKPILILNSPPPYFTFLRYYAANSQKNYLSQIATNIIGNLPASGHSQDFPKHFIQTSHYRILRKDKDALGIMEESIPEKQVLFYSDLKTMQGFTEPFFWEKT